MVKKSRCSKQKASIPTVRHVKKNKKKQLISQSQLEAQCATQYSRSRQTATLQVSMSHCGLIAPL